MDKLSKDEVIAAIERKNPPRIPMHKMDYLNGETRRKYQNELQPLFSKYPDDVIRGSYPQPEWESLGTTPTNNKGVDNRIIIADYSNLGAICEKIAYFGKHLDMNVAQSLRTENPDYYCLGYSWFCLYERLWKLRGMENILIDFYAHPKEVKTMMRVICDFHLQAIRNYGECGYDGISISDDLGTQTSTMFSREIFDTFYKPLYRELFLAAHDYGMHTWMHSCGYVETLLEDLIEVGLDVIHPIQHSTFPGGVSANNPKRIVDLYGGKISFWAGIDVQYLLPRGTVEDVRRGVRELIDTFDTSEGGMVIAAGNGIMPETPFENIAAFYDEAYEYGRKKRPILI